MKRFYITFLVVNLFCLSIVENTKIFAETETDQNAKFIAYTVGVNDVLEINVLQPEKLITVITVSPDGSITFPYIGNIFVEGKSLAKVQDMIQKHLANFMKYPIVSVSLKESRSRKFFISGDIKKTGFYIIKENITPLKAISIAGGFLSYGHYSHIKILRQKKDRSDYEVININVRNIMEGNSGQDLLIQPGDVIEVLEGKFYVSGGIAKPGMYILKNNTTLFKAISMAGGVDRDGIYNRVRILRQKKDISGEIINIDLDRDYDQNIMIQPGDVIEVLKEVNKFYIYGEITRPAMYTVEKNTTLIKAISMAGGFLRSSTYSNIKILRQNKDGAGYKIININIKDVMDEESSHNMIIQPDDVIEVLRSKFFIYGDVTKPDKYIIETNTTLLKAISTAGGFITKGYDKRVKILRQKEVGPGYEVITININNFKEDDGTQDFRIQPNDVIEVMKNEFYVYGSVASPGVYGMKEYTTLIKAISMAGGFRIEGFYKSVKILRRNKEKSGYKIIRININKETTNDDAQNFQIQHGDIIEVMESENNFYIYGNVDKPGMYLIKKNTTLIKAISIAGGFEIGNSSNRIELIRCKEDKSGYETIKINVKNLTSNDMTQGRQIQPGDVIKVVGGRFYVYGEVIKPGIYPLEENITVLKAISIVGGFSKYGSASRVKVLRQRKDKSLEYETIKININDILNGSAEADIILQPEDIVVVSEGVF